MGSFNLQNAVNSIRESEERDIRYARQEAESKRKKLDNGALARCLLAWEGFTDLRFHDWSCEFHLTLGNPRDLVRVRRALGVKLAVTGRKELVERSRSKVWVYVSAEGFSALVIRYKAKLHEQGRCKIVKRRRVYSERSIVCEC